MRGHGVSQRRRQSSNGSRSCGPNHLSKPDIGSAKFRNWEHEIGNLAKSPNVSCKLSGLVTQAQWESWTADQLRPYAYIALDAFGPGRVMFGSYWPVCLVAASYDTTLQLAHDLTDPLTGPEKDMVFGGTAARIYRLEAQP
ncbi:amidohydrolase family protein [Candidatus Poriferisocius sp.]|uniref:amidohydrolase family protein n=1 Tax=Candidatus Poriferisocius sp. TaxID=3101276 RepID=UPI003B010544